MMHIKFYGIRGVFPTSVQMVCIVLETITGKLLIDIGSCNIFQESKIIEDVSHILISHNHHDHIAMLPHFILARYHRSQAIGKLLPKCLIVSPEPLTHIMSSMGLDEYNDYEHSINLPKQFLGLRCESLITNHPPKNYCYKIQSTSHTIVYTGDTSYFPDLIDFCRDADLLICEASYSDKSLEKAKRWGHMTPSMVSRLINETNINNIILTHFVEIEGSDFVYEVKKCIKRSINVIAAYEGMQISNFNLSQKRVDYDFL